MAQFPTRTVTLKNGKILTIRNPEINDAQTLVDYINQVSAESDNLSFGAGEGSIYKRARDQIHYLTKNRSAQNYGSGRD